MAIDSGVRPHTAFIEAGGQRFPVLQGQVTLTATRESASFHVTLPMNLDGVEAAFAAPDGLDATIIVNDETLLTGELDTANFTYIRGLLDLSGRCKSAKLHETKVSDSWLNKRPDEIIRELAEKAGLQADAPKGQLKAGRIWDQDWVKLSAGVSASSTLHKLCEMMGWRWWVDADGKLTVAEKGDAAGAYSIYYRPPTALLPAQSDAIEISVRKNYRASQDIKVTVKSWHQKKKKTIEKTATVPLPPSRPASLGGAGGSGGAAGGGGLEYEYNVPSLDDDHVEQFAKSKAREHARHREEVEVSCVGDPACRPGKQLQLSGTAFDGAYDIDSVEHSFGMGGYTMTISSRTDPPDATSEQ